MEIDVEHILDCLDRYGKGELTKNNLAEALTVAEKDFLIMHQGFLESDNDSHEDFDVLDWLDEENSFFMIVEVEERLCREAESVLKALDVEMPDAIEGFLKQLIETKRLPIALED